MKKKKPKKMPVTIEKIRERLKKPKHQQEVQRAISHERRVRFHTQTTLNANDPTVSVTEFLNWVQSKLPIDKYRLFVAAFTFPHENVVLCDEIFDVLDKIFDGQDSADNLQFSTRELLQDANLFLEESEFKKKWRKRAMQTYKARFNSIMIVDLLTEQTTDRPEPYYYFLGLESVIDFEDKGEDFEYLIFDIDKDKLAVLDDASYRIFQKIGESKTEIESEPITESAHNLTYCPAKWFISDSVNVTEPYTKKSVLSSYISHLDKHLYFAISKQILDDYAPYPLIWVYDEDCDYSIDAGRGKGGHSCNKGFLVNDQQSTLLNSDGTPKRCPSCESRRMTGAGGLIKVSPPTDKEDADLRQPVGVVEMGVTQLNYNVEECERRKRAIFEGVTGNIMDTSKEAINEKQVMSLFESRKAVLLKVKQTFERAEKWILQTIFKLRYDSLFINCSVNYGTEFFLFDATTLLQVYQDAREARLDSIILDYLQDQYFATRYRNNREQFAKVQIVLNLDPFRHLDSSQVQAMFEKGQIEYKDYILKVNLSTLIQRFERENILITEFGKGLEFNTRINRIKTSLENYIVQPVAKLPEPIAAQ